MVAALGAALAAGLKKEPVPCDLCAGNGGIRCFACQGTQLIDPGLLEDGAAAVGSSSSSPSGTGRVSPLRPSGGGNPRACRVCKGTGLVLCSKCRGSGYMSSF